MNMNNQRWENEVLCKRRQGRDYYSNLLPGSVVSLIENQDGELESLALVSENGLVFNLLPEMKLSTWAIEPIRWVPLELRLLLS